MFPRRRGGESQACVCGGCMTRAYSCPVWRYSCPQTDGLGRQGRLGVAKTDPGPRAMVRSLKSSASTSMGGVARHGRETGRNGPGRNGPALCGSTVTSGSRGRRLAACPFAPPRISDRTPSGGDSHRWLRMFRNGRGAFGVGVPPLGGRRSRDSVPAEAGTPTRR